MSTQMQLRGGTTAENLLFTGAQREITVDTDKNTIVVQDGITAGGFPLAGERTVTDGTFYFDDDTAGGSAADAYILAPKANTNVPTSYMDGIQLGFTTANANTGPSTANFQGLGVKNLKFRGGIDPLAGDINGRVYLIYDAVNDWLEIQRQATGPSPQIRTIAGSVAGNALTASLVAPAVIDFRSATLNSGAITSINVAANLSIVVPAGATLGTTNATSSRIVLLAINNAGTPELAVVNVSGGFNFDETTLINTTTISAGSSSASVAYSTTGRTGVAFRVLGFIDSTQAIAGTWASTPTEIQGQGGQTIIGRTSSALGVVQNTTSGTSIDFTGIPAGVRRIDIQMKGVSTNGTARYLIQIGDSGGVKTTAYVGSASFSVGGAVGGLNYSAGFDLLGTSPAAASLFSGIVSLRLLNPATNLWVEEHMVSSETSVGSFYGSGGNTLTSSLDRIRLTTVGADTFDAGSINIIYE